MLCCSVRTVCVLCVCVCVYGSYLCVKMLSCALWEQHVLMERVLVVQVARKRHWSLMYLGGLFLLGELVQLGHELGLALLALLNLHAHRTCTQMTLSLLNARACVITDTRDLLLYWWCASYELGLALLAAPGCARAHRHLAY